MSELLDALEIAREVQAGNRAPSEVVRQALDRAEDLQEKYRTFIALMPEQAMQQAKKVKARLSRGEQLPLAGVPFAIKDIIDVEGMATTCGSVVFAQQIARETALVVKRLTEAGAVLLGKLNMFECAYGCTGRNPYHGDCWNPWDPDCISGGSSSGSAVAVALGICPFTLGSDTGGSIRHPASLCGVLGLKPTYGRVSRGGVMPLAWSLDTIGPLCRSTADAATVLGIIAGKDPADETSSKRPVADYLAEMGKPIKGLRLGVPSEGFFDLLQGEVKEMVETALAALVKMGCKRVEVTLPHLEEAIAAHHTIMYSEASAFHQPYLATRGREYSEETRIMLMSGLFLPAVDYIKAQRARRLIRRDWAQVFSEVDCLVTPSTPLVASHPDETVPGPPGSPKTLSAACLDLLQPFNLSGHPALSVPCGFVNDRLPVGMQLVGRPFDEGTLLRLAHQYQQTTDWHRRVPSTEALPTEIAPAE